MTINNRFRLNEKIYKGGFGEIMKAKDLRNGEEVVVKIVSVSFVLTSACYYSKLTMTLIKLKYKLCRN
jgi:serine/threonine protein kinase